MEYPSSTAAIMQFCYLFLAFAMVSVKSESIDINSKTDASLVKFNEVIRQQRKTFSLLPGGASITPSVSFSVSALFGFDSLKRTADCTANTEGTSETFDLHYGFSMLEHFFSILKIDGNEMSAAYRIKDNSVNLKFTVHNATECYVTLDDLHIERLAKVEFSASRPEYDGIDVEDFFDKKVLPFVDERLNKIKVEKALQTICKLGAQDVLEHSPLIYMSVLDNVEGLYQL